MIARQTRNALIPGTEILVLFAASAWPWKRSSGCWPDREQPRNGGSERPATSGTVLASDLTGTF